MLEKTVERYFVKKVKELGFKAYKFKSPNNRGVSDRIVIADKKVWFVELKRPDGRVSELQTLFAEDMRTLGQLYACLYSKEEVDQWISRF